MPVNDRAADTPIAFEAVGAAIRTSGETRATADMIERRGIKGARED